MKIFKPEFVLGRRTGKFVIEVGRVILHKFLEDQKFMIPCYSEDWEEEITQEFTITLGRHKSELSCF